MHFTFPIRFVSGLCPVCIAWLIVLLTGCRSVSDRLSEREDDADKGLERVAYLLARQDMDSLHIVTTANPAVSYFIFNGTELVYWSDSRLCTDSIDWQHPDEWHEADWKNARVVFKWRRWGGLRLMAVLPLLWKDISREVLAGSVSYKPLLQPDESAGGWWQRAHARTSVFFLIIIILFVAIFIAGLWGLVQAHGIRNMHLQTKFQYLFISLILVGFLYVFWMLVLYVRKNHFVRQQNSLSDKCLYIKAVLQDAGGDKNLGQLARTYGVDIHIYDLDGRLIATSTPQLFEEGCLSDRLAPAVLFGDMQLTDTVPLVRFERMGEVRYLTAYTVLGNSRQKRSGYLAVPFFFSADEMRMEIDRFLARLLPAYVVVLLLAVFLSVFISKSLVRPIKRLSEKMKNYRFGKDDNYIHYDDHDEVGELAGRYNALVDSLDEAFRRLAQSERDSAWRTMARQIAHEINNPLTPMKLTIQQLQRTKGTERFDGYFPKATRTLLEQMDTLSRIASSFSTFAKMPDVTAAEVDVAEKLTAAIALFAHNEQNVPIRYVGPNTGVTAWADNEQITEVFTNILKNALQALEGQDNGDIIVILREQDGSSESRRASDTVLITFSDNGPGINEDIQNRIFMPNFTTKSTGTGLGLAISKNIVEGSGGTITFETSEKGTKFFVRLKKRL